MAIKFLAIVDQATLAINARAVRLDSLGNLRLKENLVILVIALEILIHHNMALAIACQENAYFA